MNDLELLRKLSMRFRSDEAGATAMEYCLIAAAIGLAVVGAVNLLGSRSAKKPVAYGFVLVGVGRCEGVT